MGHHRYLRPGGNPGTIEGNGSAEYEGKDADFLLVTDGFYPAIVTWIPLPLIESFALENPE